MSGSYQSGKRTTVFFLFVAPLIRLQHRCTQKLSFTSPLITVFGLNDTIFQCHCCYFWLFRKQISYLCYTLQQNYSQFVHANVCNSRLCFLFRGFAGCDWKRTEQWKCLFLLFLFSLFVHAQLQLPCFLLIIQSPYQNGNDGCVFFMPLNCSQRRTTRVAVADLNVF